MVFPLTLVPPRECADVALVADDPGDWMIHCHFFDHLEILRATSKPLHYIDWRRRHRFGEQQRESFE